MSVEQPNIVDIVAIDKEAGHVVLTIDDHLDWPNSLARQAILEKKLRAYLMFIKGGEVHELYPMAYGKTFVFEIVFRVPPDEAGFAYLERVKATMRLEDIEVLHRVSKDSDLKLSSRSQRHIH